MSLSHPRKSDVRPLLRFRLMGWVAGRLIVRCAKLAKRHGDEHEFRHLHAAIVAGNSRECRDDACRLDDLVPRADLDAARAEAQGHLDAYWRKVRRANDGAEL